jgi:N-hydroxyarylamine O-acetyltransferase
LDIGDYLTRIRYQGPLEPTLQTLQALHQAHLLAVPFENLSIHTHQPIVLQEEALYDKIVRRRRGGFCYELNGLFAWLLRQAGFQVSLLSAGVARATGGFGPEFDHLTLLVHQLDGADWLADVGFGECFRQPLRFEANLEQVEADGQAYRLLSEAAEGEDHARGGAWVLQHFEEQQWKSQYRFSLQPHALSDFSEMCYYHQTSPASHFTRQRICSLATPTGRISLSDLRLIVTMHGKRTEQLLTSQEQYTAALAEQFGIVV